MVSAWESGSAVLLLGPSVDNEVRFSYDERCLMVLLDLVWIP